MAGAQAIVGAVTGVGEGSTSKVRSSPCTSNLSPAAAPGPDTAARAGCRQGDGAGYGGATASGAQVGNRDALKHGSYACELLDFIRSFCELLRDNTVKLELAQAGRISERYGRDVGMPAGRVR